MIYAPVLIPTVSRYEHFKNCIESLSQCTWADRTEVFVAVDYPGREKDWEGYNKIKNYLSTCGDLGFKSLNITYRETNYFFSGKGNITALKKDVLKNFDRYILSEDDNVFSSNFLVFMNKGLEKFAEDKSVFAINGYSFPNALNHGGSSFVRQCVDFSAWGYGIWRDRELSLDEKITPQYFRNCKNIKSIRRVKKCGNYRLLRYLLYIHNNQIPKDDNARSCLMNLEGLDVVMPVLSLVRNMGWDNSGIHCSSREFEVSRIFTEQEISDDDSFDFIGTGKEFYKVNQDLIVSNGLVKIGNLKLVVLLLSAAVRRWASMFRHED